MYRKGKASESDLIPEMEYARMVRQEKNPIMAPDLNGKIFTMSIIHTIVVVET